MKKTKKKMCLVLELKISLFLKVLINVVIDGIPTVSPDMSSTNKAIISRC